MKRPDQAGCRPRRLRSDFQGSRGGSRNCRERFRRKAQGAPPRAPPHRRPTRCRGRAPPFSRSPPRGLPGPASRPRRRGPAPAGGDRSLHAKEQADARERPGEVVVHARRGRPLSLRYPPNPLTHSPLPHRAARKDQPRNPPRWRRHSALPHPPAPRTSDQRKLAALRNPEDRTGFARSPTISISVHMRSLRSTVGAIFRTFISRSKICWSAGAIACTSSRSGRRSPRDVRNSFTTSNESFSSLSMDAPSLLSPTGRALLGLRPDRAAPVRDLFVQALGGRAVFVHVPDFDPIVVPDHQNFLLESRVIHEFLRDDEPALGVDPGELGARGEGAHIADRVLGLVLLQVQVPRYLLPSVAGVHPEAMLSGARAGHDKKSLFVVRVGDEGPELCGNDHSIFRVDCVPKFPDKHGYRDNLPFTTTSFPIFPRERRLKGAFPLSRRKD